MMHQPHEQDFRAKKHAEESGTSRPGNTHTNTSSKRDFKATRLAEEPGFNAGDSKKGPMLQGHETHQSARPESLVYRRRGKSRGAKIEGEEGDTQRRGKEARRLQGVGASECDLRVV